jgi:formylmethanofuran dehydrogenase subunit E
VSSFDEDLAKAVAFHGHLCAGQIIGVRMARYALDYFGIDDAAHYKDLLAYTESNRCLADPTVSVAGCNPGRKRLTMFDYGKQAVTYYDTQSGKAIRLSSKPKAQRSDDEDLLEFFNAITDEDLFNVEKVELLHIPDEYDLPGKPKRAVTCESCGEKVLDNRDVELDGRLLCKVCAGVGGYYKVDEQEKLK